MRSILSKNRAVKCPFYRFILNSRRTYGVNLGNLIAIDVEKNVDRNRFDLSVPSFGNRLMDLISAEKLRSIFDYGNYKGSRNQFLKFPFHPLIQEFRENSPNIRQNFM